MEIWQYIIEYLTIFVLVVMMVQGTNILLMRYQQSNYHLSSLFDNYKYFYTNKYNLLLIPFIPLIFFCNLFYCQLIITALALIYIFITKKKRVKGLRFTMRIIREYLLIVIVYTAINTILMYLLPYPDITGVLLTTIMLLPIYVAISSVVIFPLEYVIYCFYQQRAKKKIKSINPLTIAITGSYGKTSTKNILFSCLSPKYITFKTPHSYNTNNGIALCINEEMIKSTEVAILEYGASKKNDIKKLCKFISPDIAIITSIGYAHLKTFKNIQTTINEKTKVINYAKKTYINIDDENLKDIKGDNIITFGTSEKAKWRAKNIEYTPNGLQFLITDGNIKISAKTKLLGSFHITNILGSVAASYDLGVPKEAIELAIAQLEPVEHRLSISKKENFTIIDDSFNSNEIGFIASLDVASFYSHPILVITPGIVEAGKMSEAIHRNVAKKIATTADFVILIKNKSAEEISKNFTELSFTNYLVVTSFSEAMKYIETHYNEGTILIENDLTDIYLL